ncbi:MAG TPA: gluconate 2-dehydrogenase subunit 3 family protein [Flavobacteriaceae bacterium]|nr:gluconate 2-dehydrogenase subunit 3 family protein [Flavobacteriaceae bacterium]
MKTNQTWSRRRFSKAVISAQLLLASGALTLPLACAKTNKTENDSVLDNSQQETLKFAMDEVIPANDKMPSASQVGGVTYILEIIEELPDLLTLFEGLIAQLDEMSDYNFSKIDKSERIAILKTLEENKPELFKVLKDFTYESYYTNETVYKLIG